MSRLRRPGGEHRPAGKDGGAAHSRLDRRRHGGAAGVGVSSLADRLRGVVKPITRGANLSGSPEGKPQGLAPQASIDAAEILGGEWRESRGRRFLVVERRYGAGYRHGRVTLADCLPPWPRLELLGSNVQASVQSSVSERLLFLDLETTGLAGGAGTYAYLVGCGWFESPSSAPRCQVGCLRTRQFLRTDFAAE